MTISQRQAGLILVLLGLAGLAVAIPKNAQVAGLRDTCRVLTVYDGDTIGCDLNQNGRIEKPQEQIRMLGIDTPEMHYSRKNKTHDSAHPTDEPYAKAASVWTEHALFHQTAYLDYDHDRHDRYSRTLAYVYTQPKNGVNVGETLLQQGYARVLFIGANRKMAARYYPIEEQARRSRVGLWNGTQSAQ